MTVEAKGALKERVVRYPPPDNCNLHEAAGYHANMGGVHDGRL